MDISAAQAREFDRYVDLLLAERSRANLTSLRDPAAIRRRHFAESLALLDAVEKAGALSPPLIDIGTGAGFPGVPIRIARPDLRLTLLEATGKKAAFLERLREALGLRDVAVIHGRAEELAHDPAHREAYGLATARAVAPLPVLVELALPFLRIGGHLAALKGSGAGREVREAERSLRECGGEVVEVRALELPDSAHPPALVLIRKVAPTPARYPRRPGVPSKRPLQASAGVRDTNRRLR